jgi:hypothetical protein
VGGEVRKKYASQRALTGTAIAFLLFHFFGGSARFFLTRVRTCGIVQKVEKREQMARFACPAGEKLRWKDLAEDDTMKWWAATEDRTLPVWATARDFFTRLLALFWRRTMIPVDTPATVVDGRPESGERKAACMNDKRKIPVAYEEVILTEEAAEILEKERKTAAERPARKIRRVAVAAPATR